MTTQRTVPRPVDYAFSGRMLAVLILIASLLLTGALARSHPESQPVDVNPRIGDVPTALNKVSLEPHELACQAGDFAIPPGGHFQGIQQAMIRGEQFAIISGSSDSDSYLVLASIEDSAGRIVALKRLLPRPFKHAGGFQVIGDYLAVGIEDNDAKDSSKIWILELSQLLGPGRLKPIVEIERRGAYKCATAGAVGFAKARGRHLLFVAAWDSATIDIYRSNGKALHEPNFAFKLRETWQADKADRSDWFDQYYAAYQSINLVVDRNDRVFMVGFGKMDAANVMDTFEVKLEESVPTAKRFEKLGRRILGCRKTSFRSGSGLVITDSGVLTVLSCGHREFVIERFEPD
ncbi:MAG: hypothetical protein ACYSWW_00355 [Planctomycetota bacterium]